MFGRLRVFGTVERFYHFFGILDMGVGEGHVGLRRVGRLKGTKCVYVIDGV